MQRWTQVSLRLRKTPAKEGQRTSCRPPTGLWPAHLAFRKEDLQASWGDLDLPANPALFPWCLFWHFIQLTVAQDPTGSSAAYEVLCPLPPSVDYSPLNAGHETHCEIGLVFLSAVWRKSKGEHCMGFLFLLFLTFLFKSWEPKCHLQQHMSSEHAVNAIVKSCLRPGNWNWSWVAIKKVAYAHPTHGLLNFQHLPEFLCLPTPPPF